MASGPPPARRRRAILRALAAVVLGLAFSGLAAEAGLRLLLFGDFALAERWGARLRDPDRLADPEADEVWWILQRRFLGAERIGPADHPDPRLGWTGDRVEPGTYAHADESAVGGRRPVLLYGDSFAQCVTEREDCFEGWLARSDLADGHALVNYGVGGYGLDQTALLVLSTIDRWQGRDPLVVIGVLVESDLDRCALAFRSWPKPRLDPGADGPLAPAPVETDVERWMTAHPLPATSWLLRFLTYQDGALPEAWARRLRSGRARLDEKRALVARILAELHAELERRSVEHFVLAFHVRGPLPDDPRLAWQDAFLRERCAAIGLPLVDTRPYFAHLYGGNERNAHRFYEESGPGAGHYNALGNRVAFEALREGLERRIGAPDLARPDAWVERGEIDPVWLRERTVGFLGREARVTARSDAAAVRVGTDLGALFDAAGRETLCLHGGEHGPTEVAIALDGSPARFRARAVPRRPGERGPAGGVLVLAVLVDGIERARCDLADGGAAVDLDVDLAGAQELTLVATQADGAGRVWACLANARLDP